MTPIVATLIIAAILVILAVIGLAIGLILTGTSRLKRGSCGWRPDKKPTEECGDTIRCGLCESLHQDIEAKKAKTKQSESASEPTPPEHDSDLHS